MPQNFLSDIVGHSLSNWIKLQYYAEVFNSITVHEPKKIFKNIYLKTGMWKRKRWKRQIFLEPEAVRGYRFHFGHSYRKSKT